jgi:transposase
MDVMYERCAGLDVHKKSVVACRVRMLPDGRKEHEIGTFGTTTAQLLALLDWLQAWECSHVAMESTGEYWKPVYNILEGHVEILLVNAQHVKRVPGRKTDVSDAEWLAELLRHGLLRGSFVPGRPQRELRDLTRQRSTLVRERAAVVNRLQKVLEDANLKLASVATDITGVSARAMLEALIHGEGDPVVLADLARGRMRNKRAALEQALTGRMRDHHRFLVTNHLTHLDFLDEQIEHFTQEIARRITADTQSPTSSPNNGQPGADQPASPSESVPYPEAIELLDTIPGIDRTLAETIIAEMGTDMRRFPSADDLAAWAGVAPGNNESAGKRRSGQTTRGNPALRKGLVQAAHAAARTKTTYLAAQYHRLAARRGKKRAVVAVAHSIVVIAYYMLSRRQPYRELGSNYFDERKRETVVHHLVQRLEKFGYQVTLDLSMAPALAG